MCQISHIFLTMPFKLRESFVLTLFKRHIFFDFGTLYIVFLTEILSFGVIRNPVKFCQFCAIIEKAEHKLNLIPNKSKVEIFQFNFYLVWINTSLENFLLQVHCTSKQLV